MDTKEKIFWLILFPIIFGAGVYLSIYSLLNLHKLHETYRIITILIGGPIFSLFVLLLIYVKLFGKTELLKKIWLWE